MISLNMFTTAWASAPSCPDHFMVSSNGLLYSNRTNQLVAQNLINGYPGHITKVGGRNGVNVAIKTHINVAAAFITNPLRLPQVNHIDGNKLNSNWWNLEWCTHQQNIDHAVATGLTCCLFKRTSLTREQIEYMCRNPDHLSIAQLSRMFNCYAGSYIKNYRHLFV